MKGYKSTFEIWQDKKLPKGLQAILDTAFEQECADSKERGYFKAGFMLARHYEDFREEMEKLGEE